MIPLLELWHFTTSTRFVVLEVSVYVFLRIKYYLIIHHARTSRSSRFSLIPSGFLGSMGENTLFLGTHSPSLPHVSLYCCWEKNVQKLFFIENYRSIRRSWNDCFRSFSSSAVWFQFDCLITTNTRNIRDAGKIWRKDVKLSVSN